MKVRPPRTTSTDTPFPYTTLFRVLDALIEKVMLQAEIMEMKANPDRAAEGTVIEAKLDKGRGPVATILVNRGTLNVGVIFVVGAESGDRKSTRLNSSH